MNSAYNLIGVRLNTYKLSVESREQTKPNSSCQNHEFSETEIRLWFRSGTFSGFLVLVSVPGFEILELPG